VFANLTVTPDLDQTLTKPYSDCKPDRFANTVVNLFAEA